MIIIITVKNLRKDKFLGNEYDVYCDRRSVLGNIFVMHNENERDLVCNKYEKYFLLQMKDKESKFYIEMVRLYKIYKKFNKLNLYCWCADKRCHCNTIKEFLEKYV